MVEGGGAGGGGGERPGALGMREGEADGEARTLREGGVAGAVVGRAGRGEGVMSAWPVAETRGVMVPAHRGLRVGEMEVRMGCGRDSSSLDVEGGEVGEKAACATPAWRGLRGGEMVKLQLPQSVAHEVRGVATSHDSASSGNSSSIGVKLPMGLDLTAMMLAGGVATRSLAMWPLRAMFRVYR